VIFEDRSIDIVGIPDDDLWRARTEQLVASLSPERPTIVLTHDPIWFAKVPVGPHLTLSGHTHGGQVNLPGIGIVTNSSRAPLRWSDGLVFERGMYLYVTSGIGTSIVPLRWRVPPEISVLDITGAS
jgi:uncharacterized protein